MAILREIRYGEYPAEFKREAIQLLGSSAQPASQIERVLKELRYEGGPCGRIVARLMYQQGQCGPQG